MEVHDIILMTDTNNSVDLPHDIAILVSSRESIRESTDKYITRVSGKASIVNYSNECVERAIRMANEFYIQRPSSNNLGSYEQSL